MIGEILFLLYFATPGAFANMAPVIAAKYNWLPVLNKPIDFGKSFRGRRLLGDNKTFRGLLFGFIFALVAVLLQVWLYDSFQAIRDFSLIDYSQVCKGGLALALTIGALGGDAVMSFLKRQRGIGPGESWVPFDQIDTVIGLFIVSLFYVDVSFASWVIAFIIGAALHPLITTIAWMLKLKESPI